MQNPKRPRVHRVDYPSHLDVVPDVVDNHNIFMTGDEEYQAGSEIQRHTPFAESAPGFEDFEVLVQRLRKIILHFNGKIYAAPTISVLFDGNLNANFY